MTVVFKNPGVADVRALTTMGVNAKPNSTNPIGYFGTGFKYALAVLLRHDCRITLHAGRDRYDFTARQHTIRGEDFSIVYMNERELGFTTDLGRNWEPWQAYRELYCNAKDEGGDVSEAHDSCARDFTGRDGETWLLVDGAAIDAAHARRNEFLLLDSADPALVMSQCEIRLRPAHHIFYRGIAAYRLQIPSQFTWNVTSQQRLTEDRTIDYYGAMFAIAQGVNELPDADLIERILLAPRDMAFESKIDFGWSSIASQPGEAFKTALQRCLRHRASDTNQSARGIVSHASWGQDFDDVETFSPDPVQAQQLVEAVRFCEFLSYDVTAYPILLAERVGKHVYGQAQNGRIYLTRNAFDAGTKIVAGTLIEEFVHLREGFKDETRALQDYLLNKLVTLGERLRGRAL